MDVELFRAVASLAATSSMTKQDMARAPSKPLPVEILNKSKTGFSIPVRDWLQQSGSAKHSVRGLRGWAQTLNPPVKKQKRILALVTDAFGGYGGIALYNRDFLRALSSYPGCSEVVALPRLMSQAPEPIPENLNFITDGLRGKLSYAAALISTIRRNPNFDLIVCAHINLLPLAFLARLMTNAPIVLVIYGIDAWTPAKSALSNFLVPRIFDYVSISKITQQRFLDWARVPSTKGKILPNAIHLQSYTPGAKDSELSRRYGLDGKTVLMTLGRLVSEERYKGFDEVLEILPQLANQIPNIVYMIVGDGTDRERLIEKARQLGVEDRVIFTGFVPEAQKPAYYRLADVYVMASRGEGFGFVILEALATGIPTIASKVDGGREAIRDGMLGTLVDPDNLEEIKSAVLEALKKPKQVPQGLEYFCYSNFEQRLHGIVDEWFSIASKKAHKSPPVLEEHLVEQSLVDNHHRH